MPARAELLLQYDVQLVDKQIPEPLWPNRGPGYQRAPNDSEGESKNKEWAIKTHVCPIVFTEGTG